MNLKKHAVYILEDKNGNRYVDTTLTETGRTKLTNVILSEEIEFKLIKFYPCVSQAEVRRVEKQFKFSKDVL